MEAAIATAEPAPIAAAPASPASNLARAVEMRAAMEAEIQVREVVKAYIEKLMVEGVDYGKIPGTDKPTLLKPGAEKLIDLFRCEPLFEVTHRIEQWEDRPLFHYEFRCRIVERQSGKVLAEGFGSANSREGRHRWRNADRKCPSCGQAAIIVGKPEFGGGFVCFKKKGGCGAKYGAEEAAIVDQPTGKVENDDIFTLVNTILKMAKKRALVDGAIAIARCSDLFTQDVEDIGGHHAAPERQAPKPEHRASSPGNAGDVVIDFGKNKGMRVSELSTQQLEWYASDKCRTETVRSAASVELRARQAMGEQRSAQDREQMGSNRDWGLDDGADTPPEEGIPF
jgi:hypothetical protein